MKTPNGIDLSIKYVFKTIILIAFLTSILLLPNKFLRLSTIYYVYGFISAVFVHAIYSLVQLIAWYGMQEDIHTNLLNSFGITEESAGHVLVNHLILGVIRPSGLHWDPAYFGLWGGIILLLSLYYSNFLISFKWRKILIVILGLTWFLSFSRTGYFAVIMTIIVLSVLRKLNPSIHKIKLSKIFRISVLITVIGTSIYIGIPKELQKTFDTAIEYRFTHDENDQGSSRHLLYPIYTIEGMFHDPVHLLFGYGARNSSRAIFFSDNIKDFVDTPEAFDIESDICKMFANYGLFYFLIYIYFNYKLIFLYSKRCSFINSLFANFFLISIISILFAGFFYMYNDSRWVWLIYLYAIIYLTKPGLFSSNVLCQR